MEVPEMIEAGLALDIELPWLDMPDDEDDFLTGVTCNPDAPEECESCQ